MPKCDLQNTLRHDLQKTLRHIFRKPFSKNTSGWLLLDSTVSFGEIFAIFSKK